MLKSDHCDELDRRIHHSLILNSDSFFVNWKMWLLVNDLNRA